MKDVFFKTFFRTNWIERRSPYPSAGAHRTPETKNYTLKSMEKMEKEHVSFDPVWIVPRITHMMFVNLKEHFASQKNKKFVVKLWSNTFFVWSRSMNYISRLTPHTKTAVTLAHFTSFFQNEGKVLKEVKITPSLGTLRAVHTQGELVGSIRASMWDRDSGICSLSSCVFFIVLYFNSFMTNCDFFDMEIIF